MTTTPTTVSYTLEDVLDRFEQKMDKQFAEVNQKMDRQFAEVNQKMDRQFAEVNKQFAEVNQKMDKQFAEVNKQFAEVNKQFAEVNQKLNKLEIGQVELSGEIKTLDEKVSGIDKRLDNQEFLNRGVLVALIVALIGGAAKLFGWLPASSS
jgi:chromosome segregation ATPase